MDISTPTLHRLVDYWYEVDADPYVSDILDVVYIKKIVLPLQRAYFHKHGWPFQIYLINGAAVKVLGRAMCDEKLEAWMASSGKRTNPFHPQG